MLFTRVNETSNREWEYRKEGIKFFNNELRLREKMIANINKAKNNGEYKTRDSYFDPSVAKRFGCYDGLENSKAKRWQRDTERCRILLLEYEEAVENIGRKVGFDLGIEYWYTDTFSHPLSMEFLWKHKSP